MVLKLPWLFWTSNLSWCVCEELSPVWRDTGVSWITGESKSEMKWIWSYGSFQYTHNILSLHHGKTFSERIQHTFSRPNPVSQDHITLCLLGIMKSPWILFLFPTLLTSMPKSYTLGKFCEVQSRADMWLM